jgi:hypothetical protein
VRVMVPIGGGDGGPELSPPDRSTPEQPQTTITRAQAQVAQGLFIYPCLVISCDDSVNGNGAALSG